MILTGLENRSIARKDIVEIATKLTKEMIAESEKVSLLEGDVLNIMGAVSMILFESQISLQLRLIKEEAKEKGVPENLIRDDMFLDMVEVFRYGKDSSKK